MLASAQLKHMARFVLVCTQTTLPNLDKPGVFQARLRSQLARVQRRAAATEEVGRRPLRAPGPPPCRLQAPPARSGSARPLMHGAAKARSLIHVSMHAHRGCRLMSMLPRRHYLIRARAHCSTPALLDRRLWLCLVTAEVMELLQPCCITFSYGQGVAHLVSRQSPSVKQQPIMHSCTPEASPSHDGNKF
jgi:hypothetical protein